VTQARPDSHDPLLSHGIVTTADYLGTAVFAAQGALVASAAGLDLFGVMVIAFVAALGGGIIRDVLIGDTPPAALSGWHYPAIAFTTAALILLLRAGGLLVWPQQLVLTLDAAGLALFAVAGARKAQRFGLHPVAVVMLGAVTASGGGVIRDVLLNIVPGILRTDIYATAALAGAALMLLAQRAGLSIVGAAVAGGTACFALRMLSLVFDWRLPVVG